MCNRAFNELITNNMNKIMNIEKKVSHNNLLLGGMVMALVFSFLGIKSAEAAITGQLDLGDRGAQVSELQTFLSTDVSLYPSRLVTGYFGPLTQGGVEKFQVAQGIVSEGTPETTGYGRVGPRTMTAINARMVATGGGGFDKNAPVISGLSVSTSNSSATLNWNTNEGAAGIVYYSTTPIVMSEAGVAGQVNISGATFLSSTDMRVSHSANLSNLEPNTTYNYVVYVRDGSSNTSITWPSTFRTN